MPGPKTPPAPTHVPGTKKGEEAGLKDKRQKSRQLTATSTAEDFTGINPKHRNPIDPQMPTIRTT